MVLFSEATTEGQQASTMHRSKRDGHRVTYRAATLPVPEATRQHNWQLSRKAPARPYRAQVYSRSQVTPKYKSLRGNSGWYSAHGTPAVSFQPDTRTATPANTRQASLPRHSHRDAREVAYHAATLPAPKATRQHNWQLGGLTRSGPDRVEFKPPGSQAARDQATSGLSRLSFRPR